LNINLNIQVHINKKSISIKDRAFNFGDGLFETIHVRNNKPLFVNDHYKRLNIGCNKLAIPIIPIKLFRESINKAISNTKDCIVKIIYSRGLSEHGYAYPKNIIPQLYIFKKKLSKVKKKYFISLGFSKYNLQSNVYLSKIKHLNRIDQVLAFTMTGNSNNDDYILLNNDEKIIECVSSNIFFYIYNNGIFKFITPSLTNCGVDGIMKQQIIKFLKKRKIKVFEKDILKKDIIKFNGCFICNVIKGVQFVGKIEKRNINHIIQIENLLKNYIYE